MIYMVKYKQTLYLHPKEAKNIMGVRYFIAKASFNAFFWLSEKYVGNAVLNEMISFPRLLGFCDNGIPSSGTSFLNVGLYDKVVASAPDNLATSVEAAQESDLLDNFINWNFQ